MELIKKWWCYYFHPWKWAVQQTTNGSKLVRFCIECNKVVD